MADFEHIHSAILELPTVAGVVPVDLLALPDQLGEVIRTLVRRKEMTAEVFADIIDVEPDEALLLANELVAKGYLLVVDDDNSEEPRFCIRYARSPRHNIPLDL